MFILSIICHNNIQCKKTSIHRVSQKVKSALDFLQIKTVPILSGFSLQRHKIYEIWIYRFHETSISTFSNGLTATFYSRSHTRAINAISFFHRNIFPQCFPPAFLRDRTYPSKHSIYRNYSPAKRETGYCFHPRILRIYSRKVSQRKYDIPTPIICEPPRKCHLSRRGF